MLFPRFLSDHADPPSPKVLLKESSPNTLSQVRYRDQLGSVRAITDDTGGHAKQSVYKPFGTVTDWVLSATLAPETKGYIGERYDADAGLQYLNARYYDPELGIFIQPDWFEVTAAGVGTNRYGYSANDPVNALDPGGNKFWDWFLSRGKSDQVNSEAAQRASIRATEIRAGKTFGDRLARFLGTDRTLDRIAEKYRGRVGRSASGLAGSDGLSFLGEVAWAFPPVIKGTALGTNTINASTKLGILQKPLWTTWGNYSKVTIGGTEYAAVGSRLYTEHAVARMLPKSLGTPAGLKGPGRTVSPNLVDHIIRSGTQLQSRVGGVLRTTHTAGQVSVVTESGGSLVVTILRHAAK